LPFLKILRFNLNKEIAARAQARRTPYLSQPERNYFSVQASTWTASGSPSRRSQPLLS
jgi:hypothetical protein